MKMKVRDCTVLKDYYRKFLLQGHAAMLSYVVTTCTKSKLRAICYLTESIHVAATIEILFDKNCRTYEIGGLKIASEAIS